MNKRVKKLWLKALRSGEYQQGRGSLRPNDDSRCCLGVLCEVYRQDTQKGKWDSDGRFVAGRHDADSVELPQAVMLWAGLDDADPPLGGRSDSLRAAALNDKGKSFAFIADRIEKYL